MKIDNQKIEQQPDEDKLLFVPPCKISRVVTFENGKCPYSDCKTCAECIRTDQDVLYISWLRDTPLIEFGIV